MLSEVIMKYYVSNKITSLGGSSTVKNDCGEEVFFVKGKPFSPTRVKTVRTLDKQPLYKVRNKFFFFLLPKVFIADKDGNKIIKIKKEKYLSAKQNFVVENLTDGMPTYAIAGNVFGRTYTITRDGNTVATVTRDYNILKDSFELNSYDETVTPLLIAFVIALDNFRDKMKSQTT